MTKIEEYKKAAWTVSRLQTAVDQTLGRDSPRNDKATFSVRFTGLSKEAFSPMMFTIECAHGYYGSSSGYSDSSPELGGYLATSIQHHAGLLLDYAVKMAKDDAEKARKAAEAEARAVLTETAA